LGGVEKKIKGREEKRERSGCAPPEGNIRKGHHNKKISRKKSKNDPEDDSGELRKENPKRRAKRTR